jgi:hypothetical protein
MTVAEGRIPDLDALMARAREAERQAETVPGDPSLRAALIASVRATPLDPARPALDLLEDLLYGIHGCWLIFSEYADLGDGDHDGEDSTADLGEELEDDGTEEEFAELVRLAATEARHLLI